MTSDEQELSKQAMEVAFSPVRDVCAKLFGEPAEQIGGMLADVARVFRYRQSLRLKRLFLNVQKEAAALGIELGKVPDKTVLPLLEGASLEEDEDMHERWKWLLLNASDSEANGKVPPAFPAILAQMSPIDAKILDRIFDVLTAKLDEPRALIEWPRIEPNDIHEVLRDCGAEALLAPLDNLIRQELIHREPRVSVSRRMIEYDFAQLPNSIHTSFEYALTALGFEFVTACRKPSSHD